MLFSTFYGKKIEYMLLGEGDGDVFYRTLIPTESLAKLWI